MKLIITTNAFGTIKISGIDVSTVKFYGPTDGYNGKDNKNFSTIGFVVPEAFVIAEEIKKKFQLNPKHCDVNSYIWIRAKFESYEKDQRPRIGIRLDNGYRGMTNPPEFRFENE